MRKLALIALLLPVVSSAGPAAWGSSSSVSSSGVSKKAITAPDFLPTPGDIAIYVATTGSDSNPGTAALPLLTLQAAMAKIPLRWTGKARINLAAGTYSITGPYTARFGAPISGTTGQPLAIQGAIVDSGLGERTITSVGGTAGNIWQATGSIYQIKDNTISATLNQYGDGYFLRMTSGTFSGMRRMIRSNTVDGQFEITSGDGAYYSSHIAPGDKFVVEKPNSIISIAGGDLHLQSSSPGGEADLILYQVGFITTGSVGLDIDPGTSVIGNTVTANFGSGGSLKIKRNSLLVGGKYVTKVADDLLGSANNYADGIVIVRSTYSAYCVSDTGGTVSGAFVLRNCGVRAGSTDSTTVGSSVGIKPLDLIGGGVILSAGSNNSVDVGGDYYGPAGRIWNSPITGLDLASARGYNIGLLDISNSVGDAILVEYGSNVNIGYITGTGNGGAGLRLATAGNMVYERAGMTVTGTAGEIVADTIVGTQASVTSGIPFVHPIAGVVFKDAISMPNLPVAAIQVVGSASACVACVAALRGQVCFVQGGAGVKDATTICAKDATDTYDWRVLY